MSAWLLVSMGAGAACAMASFLWLSSVLSAGGGEDRRYKDRPPAFWRLAWPLTQPVAAHLGAWLSARSRQVQLERLRRAGLEHTLSPEQFIAGRVVAALAAGAFAAAVWSPRGAPPLALLAGAAALGYWLPASWLRDGIEARRRAVLRELPFYLDVITLAVESGLNLPVALAQAVDKGPRGPLRVELGRVLRDLKAGRPRAEALRAFSDRLSTPAVSSLVAALLVAEKQGSSLGPVLRAQAEQRRNERFLRAEKLAMEAPVKMLPPLLVFVFPCTFLILLFPVASRFLEEGWLR
ncbi:MAG TPA: type II secretion system F family protein [Quisquiliibacterium sp.]|nr:type II secretion system F family protein [Quisquiliibacterium sp.]